MTVMVLVLVGATLFVWLVVGLPLASVPSISSLTAKPGVSAAAANPVRATKRDAAAATGVVLTKLDGTAKGGVVVAIARELGLPVRYVGVGEKAGDLLPFEPKEFVESLFG